MRWPIIWLGLSLCVVGCRPSDSPAQAKQATSPPVAVPPALEEILFPTVPEEPKAVEVDWKLNLPAPFEQRVRDRNYMDQMAALLHQVAMRVQPAPQRYQPQTRMEPSSIRVIRHQPPPDQLAYWRAMPADFRPLRGFRAPLGEGEDFWPALPAEEGTSEAEQAAALAVEESLAEEGLLSTLVRAVEALGAGPCLEDPVRAVEQLRHAGLPVDLLGYFADPERSDIVGASERVREVANQLLAGRRMESLACELASVPFFYPAREEPYEAADESGGVELALLRMQMGGGYNDGVIPGGALDIMCQLAQVLPEVDHLISVPSEFATDFRRMVRDFWPLTRPGQVTIVVEPLPLASWAQDNGKAGSLVGGEMATLAPRYATQDEISFRFLPGESLLARGLGQAGHRVLQSPFLFQGGNLLMVHDPTRDERVLVLGEAEIYRNKALGLTRQQVLSAFETEFGADRCLALPQVSFHVDYDLTVRHHRGKVFAFVNDSLSAARLVLARGVGALEKRGFLSSTEAEGIREELVANRWQGAYQGVTRKLLPLRNPLGQYPEALIDAFALDASDAPAANFRCFLTALDLLASRAWTEKTWTGPSAYGRYLGALRRLQAGVEAQRQLIEELGWAVVSVPSMPDLEASVNYLNGIHDRQRYLLPVYGGFYQAIDQIAMEVFRGVLGASVEIVPIRSAGAQRRHGAVHCTAAAYPR